jgi:hypothetical protein
VEKEDARLRCNRDTDLVGDDQAPTALEMLFREEHPDVPSKFLAVLGWQTRDVRNISLDDRAPFGRQWSATNCNSSPTLQPSEHGCWFWLTAIPVARFPRIHPATNPLVDRSSHKDGFRTRD